MSNQLPDVPREKSNNSMIVQLVTTSFSNILCWFPSSTVFLICIFAAQYPISLIVWTAVVIMPINSTINPLIFIVTTLRKLRENQSKNNFSKGLNI